MAQTYNPDEFSVGGGNDDNNKPGIFAEDTRVEKVKVGSLSYSANDFDRDDDIQIEQEFQDPEYNEIPVPKNFFKAMKNFDPTPRPLPPKAAPVATAAAKSAKAATLKEDFSSTGSAASTTEDTTPTWLQSIWKSFKLSTFVVIVFVVIEMFKEKLGMMVPRIVTDGDHNHFSTMLRSGILFTVVFFPFIFFC